ncbi:MAG: Lrp/AsnC family transcriptional regulator, partial [Dehalococcoidia bacterium]
MTDLDTIDKRLLEATQKGFPLAPEPFFELGKQLEIGQEEALQRVVALKEKSIIREISAIFDGRYLGYQSTLVALRLPPHQLDGAAGIIGQHPGVSHNYAREHAFNLWFTLALPPGANLEEETQTLAARAGAEAVLSLPAIKVFKIGVYFRLSDAVHISAHADSRRDGGNTPSGIELSRAEKAAGQELEA